jgi:hypothetical protein
MSAEQIGPSSKKRGGKRRGPGKESLELIRAARDIAEEMQPITVRGIGYKLFTRKLIASMARNEMQRVSRLLVQAREQGTIPWEWIVDETRSLECVPTWANPDAYARATARDYRRDPWHQQPLRVEVWSEKGTVRGVLKPVLDQYAIGFRVMHGFGSATAVYDVAQDGDGRDLVALYVGDYDPSGLFMSLEDLPERLRKYNGDHIMLERIALTRDHTRALPSFEAAEKRKDPRYPWFIKNHGHECWELDAMDPRELRDCVETNIKALIESDLWEDCERVNEEERASLQTLLAGWGKLVLLDPSVEMVDWNMPPAVEEPGVEA